MNAKDEEGGWERKVAPEKGWLSYKQDRNVLSKHPQNS